MKKSKYTKEIMENALAYDKKHGFTATINAFNISKATLYNWKNPGYFIRSQKNRYLKEKKSRLKYAEKHYIEKTEEIKERTKKYRETHKLERRIYMRAYLNNRYKTNLNYRLSKNLRRRVLLALQGKTKSDRTFNLIGCTIPELKIYLEKQFTEGMNWNNYGEWHIDHIKPCEKFDLEVPENQKLCFHYTNLRPLWASDNMSKGCKYEEEN